MVGIGLYFSQEHFKNLVIFLQDCSRAKDKEDSLPSGCTSSYVKKYVPSFLKFVPNVLNDAF